MWVSKRTYEDLLLSHKREIDIMTAWIEQLQGQVGAVGHSPRQDPVQNYAQAEALYTSDEQQALLDAREFGIIDDIQLEDGMKKLGFLNKEVVVNP